MVFLLKWFDCGFDFESAYILLRSSVNSVE
jgi:hypothetical protein